VTAAGAVRARQLGLLVRPTLRAMRWQPLPVAVLGAVLLLWWKDPGSASPAALIWELRAVGLLLAAGVAAAFDDRTRSTVSAVPLPLWARSGLRLLLLVGPAAVAWLALATWADSRVEGALPVLALSLEAGVVAAVVVATAAVLSRWPGLTDPGVVAGPMLAGFAFGVPGLPEQLALAPLPGPGWEAAHVRGSGLLAVAVAALAVAVRDPATRRAADARRRTGVRG
jgi:hypothetical protein